MFSTVFPLSRINEQSRLKSTEIRANLKSFVLFLNSFSIKKIGFPSGEIPSKTKLEKYNGLTPNFPDSGRFVCNSKKVLILFYS